MSDPFAAVEAWDDLPGTMARIADENLAKRLRYVAAEAAIEKFAIALEASFAREALVKAARDHLRPQSP